MLKTIGYLAAIVVGLFVLGIATHWPSDADMQRANAARRDECARAITSSIGAPVRGYADKVAYDKVVREKCEGFEINGKPVAP